MSYKIAISVEHQGVKSHVESTASWQGEAIAKLMEKLPRPLSAIIITDGEGWSRLHTPKGAVSIDHPDTLYDTLEQQRLERIHSGKETDA